MARYNGAKVKADMVATNRKQKAINQDSIELEVKWRVGDRLKPVIIMFHEGLGCVSM